MERIRVIQHRGQNILLVDLSDCPAEEVARLADQVPKAVAAQGEGVLMLADFTQSQLSRDAMERVKIAAVFNSQHLTRSAWVANGNMPMPAHDVVEKFSTREIPVFGTRDEALEYLVQES